MAKVKRRKMIIGTPHPKHVLLRMLPTDFHRLHISAEESRESLNRHVNELIKIGMEVKQKGATSTREV